jgi:hypothetical protein
MPLAEQEPAQQHALARRTQANLAKLCAEALHRAAHRRGRLGAAIESPDSIRRINLAADVWLSIG